MFQAVAGVCEKPWLDICRMEWMISDRPAEVGIQNKIVGVKWSV